MPILALFVLLALPFAKESQAGAPAFDPSTTIAVHQLSDRKDIYWADLLSHSNQALFLASPAGATDEGGELWTLDLADRREAKRLSGMPWSLLVSPGERWAAFAKYRPIETTSPGEHARGADVHIMDLRSFDTRPMTQDGRSWPEAWRSDEELVVSSGTMRFSGGTGDYRADSFYTLSTKGRARKAVSRHTVAWNGLTIKYDEAQGGNPAAVTLLYRGKAFFSTPEFPARTDPILRWAPIAVVLDDRHFVVEEYVSGQADDGGIEGGRFRLWKLSLPGKQKDLLLEYSGRAAVSVNPRKTVAAIAIKDPKPETTSLWLVSLENPTTKRQVSHEFPSTWPRVGSMAIDRIVWSKKGDYLLVQARNLGLFHVTFSK